MRSSPLPTEGGAEPPHLPQRALPPAKRAGLGRFHPPPPHGQAEGMTPRTGPPTPHSLAACLPARRPPPAVPRHPPGPAATCCPLGGAGGRAAPAANGRAAGAGRGGGRLGTLRTRLTLTEVECYRGWGCALPP